MVPCVELYLIETPADPLSLPKGTTLMRYLTLAVDGVPAVAVQDGETTRLARGGAGRTLSDLLVLPDAERVAALAPGDPAPAGARTLAPLRPATIVCVGLNYLDHIRETGMDRPRQPLLFAKLRTTVVGPDDPIRIDPAITSQVDWEVELAVVIGRRARNVGVLDATDHVFGYTVANDVSARDLQFGDGQWTRGKSLDTFGPLGPVVVTPDELGDPQALGLRTRVNGTIVQESSTREMLFGVAEIIAYISASFTLEPGDVVLTGTPWGCGAFADPPRFLQPGDEVEVEVDGIGVLRNPVIAA
jgi:2-keto-4-pentenoate hydratase/2-oxohepta-3-ene-1,7-dioic acid hydratase in catechol pathway